MVKPISLRSVTYYLIILVLIYTSSLFAADYKLGPGDKISVEVYNEDDMSISDARIPKTGLITFPLIGVVKASGLTLKQFNNKLVTLYKDGYLKKPELIINIDEYRPFFVNGQVKSPGGYPYVEGLTVRKAIAIAGGLTERASLRKVSVVKEESSESVKIKGSLDVQINPGDILSIGESLF